MSNLESDTELSSTPPWYKRRGMQFLRDALLILAIFGGISVWQTRDMLASDGSVTIPPSAMVSLDGNVHQLFQPNSSGKPTLVYFFAPWCSVCRYSIGNLNDLDPDSVNIIKIALDYTSKESVIDFVVDTNTQGPVLLGSNRIKQDFQVPGYPAYYLLDDKQRVVGSAMGYSTEWGMKLKTHLAK
ncbi:TlpA family protein disulfide reductase [Alteromonas sediminis]|uniref:TlpA family protein disulfide reductase n=1 Tax=Alteromonas sediminis TaxID=2259342 RepID=A0A3N5YR06_9ALTE|nr:thioredoxin-like domain-containing protein [Alteromonas sediminis]RPJ68761.1 TlpA family protein disulfide reductase [Alteromonas sediminis]